MSAEAIKTAVPVRGRTNTEGRLEPRSRESGANPAYWVTAGKCICGDGSRTEFQGRKTMHQDQPLELTMPQEPKESRFVLIGIGFAVAFLAGFLMGARS